MTTNRPNPLPSPAIRPSPPLPLWDLLPSAWAESYDDAHETLTYERGGARCTFTMAFLLLDSSLEPDLWPAVAAAMDRASDPGLYVIDLLLTDGIVGAVARRVSP